MKTIFIITIICAAISIPWLALLIVRGFRNAKEMPEDYEVLSRAEMAAIGQNLDKKSPDLCCGIYQGPDEHDPSAYFGEDDSEIEALKEKLMKYRDYSDIDEVDQEFMSHIR